MHRRIGQPLGDVAVEFGDRGIDAVAGMNQSGIGAETSGEIVDRLVAPDRPGEPLAAALAGGSFRELALVVRLKRDAFRVHPLQVAGDFRRVDPGIEIGQIPFRQLCRPGWIWRIPCGSVRDVLARDIADLVVIKHFQRWRGAIRQSPQASVPNGRAALRSRRAKARPCRESCAEPYTTTARSVRQATTAAD